jgi:hypothetical protein
MFSGYWHKFCCDVEDVLVIVRWQEVLRDSIHSSGNAELAALIGENGLEAFRQNAPKKIVWKTFDHCASISRLYALFEDCVCELVTAYLKFIPAYFPKYEGLREKLRVHHRSGVGTILLKWALEGSPWSHLMESEIASGMADGLRGMASYAILPDAFLTGQENFRWAALGKIFSEMGIDRPSQYIEGNRRLREFVEKELNNDQTAQGYLDSFVRLRNEAAHGTIAQVSSVAEIENFAAFSCLLVGAIAQMLTSDLVIEGLKCGKTLELAEVVRTWSDNVGGMRAATTTEISVGDEVYVGLQRLTKAEVVSIKIGKDSHDSLKVEPGFEFGMQMDASFKEGHRIYRLAKLSSASIDADDFRGDSPEPEVLDNSECGRASGILGDSN